MEASKFNTTLDLTERTGTTLSANLWLKLRGSDEFWRLVDNGVFSVEFRKSNRPTLRAGNWIGSSICGGCLIRVLEKIPGAFRALSISAGQESFKSVEASSSSTELSDLLCVIIGHFCTLLHDLASRGVEKKYLDEQRVAQIAGGRIDVGRTIGLKANGRLTSIAFTRAHLTADTRFNRIMLAAIREIEVLARLGFVSKDSLRKARSCSILFEEARASVLDLANGRFAGEAISLKNRQPFGLREKQLLDYAAILLMRESFTGQTQTSRNLPFSWFLSLEKLFENALRVSLMRAAQVGEKVFDGNINPLTLATSDQGDIRVYPDVIVKNEEEVILLDAKYKSVESVAEIQRSDLYQLAAYSIAGPALVTGLVYPGTSNELLGTSSLKNGSKVLTFIVDVRSLDGAAEFVLSKARTLPAVAEEVAM